MTPAALKLARWMDDPVRMVVDEFKVESLDPWQVEFLRAFPHRQRMAAIACKGPGKTAVISWCCWNFLLRPDAKIFAAGITEDN